MYLYIAKRGLNYDVRQNSITFFALSQAFLTGYLQKNRGLFRPQGLTDPPICVRIWR